MTPPPPGHLRLVLHIIIIPGPVHEKQNQECHKEEYAVHDAERKAGFLHCTFFLDGG